MGPFILDFEAFQYQGQFTLKELCLIDVERPFAPLYYMFAPRRGWAELSSGQKRTFDFETRELHGLEWDEGFTRYCRKCVMFHIKQSFPQWASGIFYVMEAQDNGPKVKFIQNEFPDLNIMNYNVTFDNLPYLLGNITCLHREHGPHCAYLKCLRVCNHYNNARLFL
jgi:hypothetical protein